MAAILGMRAFFLSAGRTSCGVSFDKSGIFVGDVPLFTKSRAGNWSVRPIAAINGELSACYRLPVDVTAKLGALALIANALNRGDMALAAIAAVQMQFPDPPPLIKDVESINETIRRAGELYHSGLLKADWDPTRHPRTGAPPNRAWFAPVPREVRTTSSAVTGPKIQRTGWPSPPVNQAARQEVIRAAGIFARTGRFLLLGLEIADGVTTFLAAFTPVELNQGEDRLTAQLKAALQPPKTLEELQQTPIENAIGYEKHHIVEQNDDNVRKRSAEKFGWAAIDDSINVVWVPHFPHIEISAEYSSIPNNDGGPTLRERVKNLDYSQQREFGLSMLRKYGVLK